MNVKRLLRPDVALGVAVAAAIAIHLPALFAPFTIDDFAHREMTEGTYPPGQRGPFALYDLIDDTNRAALVDRGVFPWWTHPQLVVRFLRPLSSLTLTLDYRLSPDHAWWGHLHSLFWWAAASIIVHAILKQSFSTRVARLGAFVFALSPCHAIPLLWMANREALISTTIGAAALLVYVRWRRDRRARDGALALALFALAMAAGEYSLCFTGYVVAYEVFRAREALWRRALGVAPFAFPTAGYLALRVALHFGARFGGLYFDPFWNFDAFAHDAVRRFVVLVCSSWVGLDDTVLAFQPWPLLVVAVAGTVAFLAVPVRRSLVSLSEPARADASWLLAGSVIALAPVLAVAPTARLLGTPMIGVSAIAALVIDRAWFPAQVDERRGAAELTGFAALVLAFVHFVRGPIVTLLETRNHCAIGAAMVERMDWVRDHLAGKSTVVVVRAEAFGTALFAPCMLGRPDVAWRVLSYEAGRVLVLRTGERTLELVASPRPIFVMGPGEVFRDDDGTLHAGDTVQVPGMKATVLQLEKDGMPKRVRYDFDRNLNDPSILWLRETVTGFEEQHLPERGLGEPIAP